VQGTWWAGTGDKFDADSRAPIPAAGFAVHARREVHTVVVTPGEPKQQ